MRRLALVAVLGFACSTEERVLTLGLPPSETHRTLLLSTPSVEGPSIEIVDLSKGTTDLQINVAPGDLDFGEIEALLYAQSATALMLNEGPLAPSMETAGRYLPTANRSLRASIDLDAPAAAWEETAKASDALAEFRYAAQRSCLTLNATPGTEVAGGLYFLLPLDDRRAFAGTRAGMFVFDAGGVRSIPPISTASVTAAFRLSGDRFVFGDENGRVFRATISPDEELADVTMFGNLDFAPVLSIDGGVLDDGTLELFALDAFNYLWHYREESGWIDRGRLPSVTVGALAWAGEGEVLVRSRTDAAIIAVRGEMISESFIEESGRLTSLDHVRGLGLMAGTEAGAIFRREGPQWVPFFEDGYSYGWWVLSSVPFDRGLMLLLASGNVVYIDEQRRRCSELGVAGTLLRGAILPLEDGSLALAGVAPNGRSTRLFILPRAP